MILFGKDSLDNIQVKISTENTIYNSIQLPVVAYLINFAPLMSIRIISIIAFSFILLVFSSCSNYDKLLKSDDFGNKDEMAKKYYNEGNYAKALPLLDQLLTVNLGTTKEEEIRYYIAYCYYGQSQFLVSSALFKNFFKTFPKSYRAEECLYMNAYSLYKASPRYELDQTTTYSALDEFQYFTDSYKKSERVLEANDLMDELRAKLELKMYKSGELYYKTENYLAAATTYQNLLRDFPETDKAEEISMQIIRCYFNYAGLSIVCKKPERYDMAMLAYKNFIDRFPESDLLILAKGLYDRSVSLKQKSEQEKINYNCDEQS